MQTITIDIINEKALNLLRDLELLQLIRMRDEKSENKLHSNSVNKYKGAMHKQTLTEIDNQLNELRNSWE
jgi:hypothetical protein